MASTASTNLTVPGPSIEEWVTQVKNASRPTTPLPPGETECPTHSQSANVLQTLYTEPRHWYSTDIRMCGKCVDKFTYARNDSIKEIYTKLTDTILQSCRNIFGLDPSDEIYADKIALEKAFEEEDGTNFDCGEILRMTIQTTKPSPKPHAPIDHIKDFLVSSKSDIVDHIQQMGSCLKPVHNSQPPEWLYPYEGESDKEGVKWEDGFFYSIVKSQKADNTLLVEIRSGLPPADDDEMEE